jgi:DNA-binding transcriptional regulator WhiA
MKVNVCNYKDIADKYISGETTLTLAPQYSCSPRTIANILRKQNIQIRTGGFTAQQFDESYFESIDTEKKAYFLGLIAADGSVNKPKKRNRYTFSLELLETDKYLIEELANELGYPKSKIKTYSRPNRKNTSKLVIHSERFADSLIKYGIISGKCRTFRLPRISHSDPSLFRHFLRGFYDGDGSIGKNRLSLAAGNLPLLKAIRTFLLWMFPLNPEALRIYETGPNVWTLQITRKLERKTVLMYLYKDATVYMKRKALYYSNVVVVTS